MKIRRTLPPAASPIGVESILHGLSGMIFSQRYLTHLEKSMQAYFGTNHVFLVSSGKTALMLILNALKVLAPDKTEVLIPAYTCFSVPSAIVRTGLRVSLCDVDASTFDFDYKCLADVNTENTLCIIPSHLFGMPSDMDKVRRFAKERDIFVVEDAAQAMGGRYRDKLIGTVGDVGCFSLGRGKNVTCISGGVIVTNNEDVAAAIENEYAQLEMPSYSENVQAFFTALLLAVFIRPSLYWLPSGLPFLRLGETSFSSEFPAHRLSGFRAGLMRNWQKRLEKSNHRRKENSEYFCKTAKLKNPADCSVPFLRLPYMTRDKKLRDNIYSGLARRGLGVSLMYPSSINKIPEIEAQFITSAYPAAEGIASQLLTIPTHELLSENDRKALIAFLRRIATSTTASSAEPTAYGKTGAIIIPDKGRNHV
jgi:dTDP-4-amino-4,6-dideoxygalactose transaminase